jgi:hypothetical protein
MTWHQFPKQTVTIAGAATGATAFLGVNLSGSAATNTPAQTAALIVKNKAAILAEPSTTVGSAANLGIRDIQIDPADSTKLILVYDQSVATPTVPALTASSGVSFTAAALNSINAGLTTSGGITPTPIAAAAASAGVTVGASTLLSPGLAQSPMTVTYDYNTQSFKITDSTNAGANTLTLQSGTGQSTDANNGILNLTPIPVTLNGDGLSGLKMLPNNKNPLRAVTDQRYGIKVTYDAVSKSFAVSSGTTGDKSSIEITNVSPSGTALLGLQPKTVSTSSVATRGITSEPAIAYGKPPTVNVSNNFAVDATNNSFVVTVDGIKSTVVIPPSPTYSLESFMRELQ